MWSGSRQLRVVDPCIIPFVVFMNQNIYELCTQYRQRPTVTWVVTHEFLLFLHALAVQSIDLTTSPTVLTAKKHGCQEITCHCANWNPTRCWMFSREVMWSHKVYLLVGLLTVFDSKRLKSWLVTQRILDNPDSISLDPPECECTRCPYSRRGSLSKRQNNVSYFYNDVSK